MPICLGKALTPLKIDLTCNGGRLFLTLREGGALLQVTSSPAERA